MYSFEMTKYPEIYKETSWGNFTHRENEEDIITNRNKFINDYNIKGIGGCKTIDHFLDKGRNYSSYRLFMDHCEVYRTNDKKYILIISPYYGALKRFSFFNEFKEQFGFKEIYKLYHREANTMIKIIDNLKELRKETKYI